MSEGRSRLWGILAVSILVGVCGGLLGVGGGVLLVPLLVLVFGFEQHRAQGTSLVALVPPTGLLAFLAYYRAHEVDVKVGLLIIPGIFLGGLLGGGLAARLSSQKMRLVFAGFVFLLGAWQVFSAWSR
jgi:uncharacterized membrane protein YfcA